MNLTASGEYALRAMVHLAAFPAGTVLSIGDIGDAWDIPVEFLRKLMAPLREAGLVRSRRGWSGGIELARPSNTITALDVVEAVEGPISMNECVANPKECRRSTRCTLRILWAETEEKNRETLRKHSLAELAMTGSGSIKK